MNEDVKPVLIVLGVLIIALSIDAIIEYFKRRL